MQLIFAGPQLVAGLQFVEPLLHRKLSFLASITQGLVGVGVNREIYYYIIIACCWSTSIITPCYQSGYRF